MKKLLVFVVLVLSIALFLLIYEIIPEIQIDEVQAAVVFFQNSSIATVGLFFSMLVFIYSIMSIAVIAAGKLQVIDRLGTFKKKEGLCIILWLIDKKGKEFVKEGREISVPLWNHDDKEGEEKITINMKDNSQIILKNPKAFFEIGNIITAMNRAEDFVDNFVSLLDDRLSGHFSNLTEKNIFEERKKDLAKVIREIDSQEDQKLKKLEQKTEVGLERITIDDFDFTPPVEKKRNEKYDSKQDIEIAKNKAKATAIEGIGERDKISAILSSMTETFKELIEERGLSNKEATQVTMQAFQDTLAKENNALKKQVFEGLGGIAGFSAQMEIGKNAASDSNSSNSSKKSSESSKGTTFVDDKGKDLFTI